MFDRIRRALAGPHRHTWTQLDFNYGDLPCRWCPSCYATEMVFDGSWVDVGTRDPDELARSRQLFSDQGWLTPPLAWPKGARWE
jgi:hypothetical protein